MDEEHGKDLQSCPLKNRLAYSKYQLSSEAVHKWASMKLILEEVGEDITWKLFKNKFYA